MALSTIQATDLLAVARDYAAQPDEWPFAPRFDPAQRWYHRLAVTDEYEAWVLTWLPGQVTDLHDHGGSAGAFVVVSGTVTEQLVSGNRLVDRQYSAGQGHGFGHHYVHRVGNASERPAVTVHTYGPAIKAMTKYRLEAAGLVVESITRAGEDW
jgi:hypothetical protein